MIVRKEHKQSSNALGHKQTQLIVAFIVEQVSANVVVEWKSFEQLDLSFKVGSA